MRLYEHVKKVLYADEFVTIHRAKEERRNQRGIALIASVAFLIMSILNIRQQSYIMLCSTVGCSLFLFIGYYMSKYHNCDIFLKAVYIVICVVIFTSYTILGGNDGFAILWILIATYAFMISIDFKAGFIINVYYLIMLLLVFIGPLSFLLQYQYSPTFLLRFPFLYVINFAFATYIAIRIRTYQYEILINQQKLEFQSHMDLSTGVKNRNSFIQYEKNFQSADIDHLIGVFIDVNGLHEVNNLQGHYAGDQMLRLIADLCKEYFLNSEIFRMGGDEFLILCPNALLDEVEKTIKEVSNKIDEAGYSISYGIALQTEALDINEIVKMADYKMNEYKKHYYKSVNSRRR